MSTEADVARSLGSWLKENRHEDADRVLDAVFDQVPATPQRRASWPARRTYMNSIARFGLAVVAVAVVALVGYRLGLSTSGEGPASSTSPAVSASETSAATATPLPGTVLPPGFQSGKAALQIDGVGLSFDVQAAAYDIQAGTGRAEWETFGGFYMTKNIVGPQDAEAIILWTSFPSNLHADPCTYLLGQPADASTADLALAVSAAPGIDLVAGPSEVMVGGRTAVRVVVRVRDAGLGCPPAYFYSYPVTTGYAGANWVATQPGDKITVWIVDVHGKRLFIEAETRAEADQFQYPGGAPSLDKEIQAIIDSIQFE